MKLLGSNTSPYARKVRLLLLEKSIPHDFIVDFATPPDNPLALANPLKRIPALILEDGFCVFDSPVITDYADSLNDEPVLIPKNDALARMRVKRWEALADGIIDSAVVVRVESIRPAEKQHPPTLVFHNQAIDQALNFAAQLLGERTWCEGENLSLADLALISALLYLDLRQPERNWRTTYPNLAQWFTKISQRASVQEAIKLV